MFKKTDAVGMIDVGSEAEKHGPAADGTHRILIQTAFFFQNRQIDHMETMPDHLLNDEIQLRLGQMLQATMLATYD